MIVAIAAIVGLRIIDSDVALAAPPDVVIADSMRQIRPVGLVSGLVTSASLTAVRNEAESIQLVVNGPASNVSVAGDLFGWGTTSLYRVGYYESLVASDREGGTGFWGDALIPESDVMYHENRSAFPFDVTDGRNQVVWVDVFVPPATPPGLYIDWLSVSSDAGSRSVQVTMEVIDWTMPATSSMRSAFYMTYDNGLSKVCRAHTGNGTCNGNATQLRTLHGLYSRLGLENRVSIANGSGLNVDKSPADGDPSGQWETLYEAPVIRGQPAGPPGASWRLSGARNTVISQYGYTDYSCDAPCADEWEAEAHEPGQDFSDRFVWYACDEPNDSVTAWNRCGQYFEPVQQAWDAPAMVVASINQYTARPAGTPTAQILTVLSKFMQGKPGQAYAGNQRANYNTFLATPGNEIWLYTACDSFACGPPSPDDEHPLFDGWPGYAIDAPAVQSRAESWMVDKFDASGELYWAVDQRLYEAWAPGGQYDSGGNGDGTLFYPGTPTSVNGSVAIGGVHDIPLESIRLKRIRDGREDYEYLVHLREEGLDASVDAIVSGLFPTHYSAVAGKDGNGIGSLLQARESLLQLMRVVHPSAGRIVFSSDRDGNFEIYAMNADGTGTTRLTSDPAADRFPAWSPDGDRISWTRGGDVMVMDADGTNVVNLTPGGADVAEKPTWWMDGTSVAYVRRSPGGRSEIWRVSAQGTGAPVALVAEPSADVFDPVIDSGAGRIVYSSTSGNARSDLMSADLLGNDRRPVPAINGAGVVNEVADVAPVAGRLTFSRSVGAAPYEIIAADRTGANAAVVSGSVGGVGSNEFQSTWSPDEQSLAFSSSAAGSFDIWRTTASGASPVQLTSGGALDLDPDWGPLEPTSRSPTGPPTITVPPPVTTTTPPSTSVPSPLPADFVGIDPARITDTRADGITIDDRQAQTGVVAAGSPRSVTIRGRAGVPLDAVAAVLNVTVTEPAGAGFATVYPCGETRPTASNLNFVAGQTVPNAVIARLGVDGDVCVFANVAVHLVVDVNGYFPVASGYRPVVPARLLDSRPGGLTIDGGSAAMGTVGAGSTLRLAVAGRGGAATSAVAAALNVTAVGATGPGFLTVYPCGADRPLSSSVNFIDASPVPNAVVTPIGDGASVCIFASNTAHVVVDINGWYPPSTSLESLVPARLLDTRSDGVTIDGVAVGLGRTAGMPVALQVSGRGGVASGGRSVILNVTVTEPVAAGFVTVYSCDSPRPTASNLNFVAGQTVANLVMTRVAANGSVCLFSNVAVHLVVDVVGSHTGGSR